MLGVGQISRLHYSDRLMEFPLGLFGIALATVTLPYLSRQAARGAHGEFSATLDWSMKLALLVAVPATLALMVLAVPLVATIFYGGEFDATDVILTALALQAFAIGLLGFSFVKILAPAYFAREDTRTPVRIGLIALAVNFLLSVTLAWYLTRIGFAGSHAGLALATSVAAVVNASLLYRGLYRDGVIRHSEGWLSLLLRLSFANAVMIVILWWLGRPADWWLAAALGERILQLGLLVVAGGAGYVAALLLAGMRPAQFALENR